MHPLLLCRANSFPHVPATAHGELHVQAATAVVRQVLQETGGGLLRRDAESHQGQTINHSVSQHRPFSLRILRKETKNWLTAKKRLVLYRHLWQISFFYTGCIIKSLLVCIP